MFKFVVFFSLFFPLSIQANQLSLRDLEIQRTQFIKAENALKAEKIKEFKLLTFELTDYPLYPYLQYEYLLDKISSTSLQEIKNFEKNYPDFPKNEKLREAWLNVQAGLGNWRGYLAEYAPSNKTGFQCRALYATYLIDQDSNSLKKGLPLWLVPHSQPGACDPLFKAMNQMGIIDKAAYWKRVTLSLDKRNINVAQHLKPNFSAKEQAQINTWIKVLEQPNLIKTKQVFKTFPPNHPLIKTIIVQSLQQYAKDNPFGTMQLLDEAKKRYMLTPIETGKVEKSIALSLSVRRHELAQQWLDKIPASLLDKTIYEWQIRNAIKKQNWKKVLYITERLPPKLKNTKRWRYWQGYAWKQLGDQEKANAIFAKLAPMRNYYGFLASLDLKRPYNIQNKPMKVESPLLRRVSTMPNVMRTRELIQMDRVHSARAEWRYAIANLNEAERQAAARIAYQMKWYDFGILALSKAKYKHDVGVRFPLAYFDTVVREAKGNQIEPAWVFAVIRQESAFTHDAYSHAGAIGLMQLMPTTAHYVAGKTAYRLNSTLELKRVDTNVRLGTAYLKHLSTLMASNPVLVAASYNAGPGRTKSWLPSKSIPAQQWIETIPYVETREYVKNVITYIGIYRQLLGEETSIADLIPPIPPSAS